MKKLLLFLCVVFAALSSNAQQVYNLSKVVKDGISFTAYAGDLSLPINPYLYKRVKAAPSTYVMVVYNGERGSMVTLAHRGNVHHSVLQVDSIGLDDQDVAEVYLSDVNGKKSVYKSQNDEWLKVLKGQHVESWYVDGETKTLTYVHTVGRDIPLTNDIPYEEAPLVAQVTTTTLTPAPTPAPVNNTATRPTLIRR